MTKKYFNYAVTFSFVDEYDNFVAAHFMLKGKKLFSEIFHNRQLGPVYLSYLIQLMTQPKNLYELIIYHRLFIIIYSFLFAIFLSWRFGLVGIMFILLYEPIKYYVHGNLFLGESFIIYPLVYLFFLITLDKRNTLTILESILIGIFSWFVFFIREPYIPLVFLLLIVYGLKFKNRKLFFLTLSVFIFFSLITLLTVDLFHYFYQLVKVNSVRVFSSIEDGLNLIASSKSFFYPLVILFGEKENYFWMILNIYSILFLFLMILVKTTLNKKWLLFFIFIVLGLAAIRTVETRGVFYGTYRIIQWIGLLIASILLLIRLLYQNKKNFLTLILVSVLGLIFLSYFFSGESFVWKKINREDSFNINYNQYFVNGEVVKILSDKDDTLFINGYESLIFWQAGIPSSYRYTLYYPVMEGIDLFDQEKNNMFKNKPPTFYFQSCLYKKVNKLEILVNYKQFFNTITGKDTCLYIHKKKIGELSEKQIELVKKYNYQLK